jgi:uncharacterized protein YoxC
MPDDVSPSGAAASNADKPLDFAEAAETLVALQEQLGRFEHLTRTLGEVADAGTELADASEALAQAQKRLAEQTQEPSDINASVAQSVAALHESVRSLNAGMQDIMEEVGAQGESGGTRRRRSSTNGPWNAATFSILTGIALVLIVVIVQWQTLDLSALESTSSSAEQTPEPEPQTVVEQTLYPHHEPIIQVEDLRVQVLNGVGQAGLASRFQERVEATGAQVPEIGNLPTGTAPETIIYLHRNAFDMAEIVADALGLDRRRIVPGPPASEAAVDLTLVVGRDYQTLE